MKKTIYYSVIFLFFIVVAVSFIPKKKTVIINKEKINNSLIECYPNYYEDAIIYSNNAPQAILPPRKNFNSLLPLEQKNIEYAIAAMKKRSQIDPNDPLGWDFQVRIHNGPTDGFNPPIEPFKTCQHGNCYFLAWHRMYLYFFERILIKNMDQTQPIPSLPYWDNANVINNEIPHLFRQIPTSTIPNSLYDARNSSLNDELNPAPMLASISNNYATALTESNYYRFQAVLENAHGNVHRLVGTWIANNQVVVGKMFDGDTAADDPLFFLHHANVDRLWEVWLNIAGNKNPNKSCDNLWWNKSFAFYDSTGKKVSLKCKDVIKTDNPYLLNYKYDNVATPILIEKDKCKKPLKKCPVVKLPLAKIVKRNSTVNSKVSKLYFEGVAVAREYENLLKRNVVVDLGKNENSLEVFLEFENLRNTSGTVGCVEVYINPKSINLTELKPSRSNFVGLIDLFTPKAVMEHQHDESPYIQRINITNALRKKGITFLDLQKLKVVFLTRGVSKNGKEEKIKVNLVIGKLSLSLYKYNKLYAED
jgi:Common central domain of tyrosinase/Polyphenol oxidase middle domain